MKRSTWIIVVWLALITTAQATVFDCSKTSNAEEQRLCSNTDLWLSPDCSKLLLATDKRQIEKWSNTGSSTKAAEMLLFDNGLLVVDSDMFSTDVEKRYFQWSKNTKKDALYITVCDSRTKDLIPMEATNIGVEILKIDDLSKHSSYAVLKVDDSTNTISYAILSKSIIFGGWNFYKE
jgi:hypothetical protein